MTYSHYLKFITSFIQDSVEENLDPYSKKRKSTNFSKFEQNDYTGMTMDIRRKFSYFPFFKYFKRFSIVEP